MNQPGDELELLRRLRQLPGEREPSRDLWAGIESRLGGKATSASAHRARRWGWTGLAAAASLALAIGLNTRPEPVATPSASLVHSPDSSRGANEFVRREADAITIEYQLAIEPFSAATLPPELHAAATELDSSAQQIQYALRAQPDATYLLGRLRRTYEQRLKLAQRAALG